MRKFLAFLLTGIAFAQAPNVPVTGNVGAGGNFPFRPSGTVAMTDADHTMVYPETAWGLVKLTGTLTAQRNLITLTGDFSFCVKNGTNQPVQIIGIGGTGVVVINGTMQCVQGDGTNYTTTPNSSPNITAQTSVFNGISPATGGIGLTQIRAVSPCNGSGFSLGNNGTSAQGWSGCNVFYTTMQANQPGIHQMFSNYFDKTANGDSAVSYDYMSAFGGATASSDEGAEAHVTQLYQRGFVSGVVTLGASTGSPQITAGSTTCTGYCLAPYSGNFFNAGGILLDTQTAGITARIVDCVYPGIAQATCSGGGLAATGVNTMYYDISGATVPVSTAWGTLIPASCTVRSASLFQVLQSMTCNVTLGTGSGNFAATSVHAQLSGPFQEESIITAVGVPSGGIQAVTFTSRYAWDAANGNTNSAAIMQGGPSGQAIIKAGSLGWPVSYQVIGATSPTRIYFSNCTSGNCNGVSGSNIIVPNIVNFSSGTLTRTSNVVTLTNPNEPYAVSIYPVGSSLVVTGAVDTTFNGTFTVASNTLDEFNPVITWSQTATNSTTSTFNIALQNTQITLYPMAFIIGTNNGIVGVAQLGTNSIPFTVGDSVISAPSSEYGAKSLFLVQGQNTPFDPSGGSNIITLADAGPRPPTTIFNVTNPRSAGVPYVAGNMFTANGGFANYFNLGFRPANNGAIIFEGGADPVAGAVNLPYRLFLDSQSGMQIIVNPATGILGLPGITSVSIAPVYNSSGTVQISAHTVRGSVTVAAVSTPVTLTGAAAFTSASSYSCTWSAESITAGSTNIPLSYSSGNTFVIAGNYGGTFNGVARYICTGN